MKNTTVAIIVFGLVLCFTVGGALAWLIDETPSVTNTFTYGDINIDLSETTPPLYKMVPGKVLSKDPMVTVKANSEKCWLFVRVDESANLSQFVKYQINTGENDWTALESVSGVYYRTGEASTKDQMFSVLAGGTYTSSDLSETLSWSENQVLVKPEVEKEDLNALDASGVESAAYPTLTFTAYAVQYEGFEGNPAAAWAQIQSANTTTTTP